MAKFSRLRVLSTTVETGLIPILYHPDVEVALRAVDGCVAGGAKVFEFTNRGDGAFRTFEELVRRCRERYPDLIIGVGSIGDPHVAAHFLSGGTDFIVSPQWNPELATLCNSLKVALIPGCGSVSEIAAAESLGCELVKIFPAGSIGGPGFIKAVLGPRPWSRLVPTSGVAPEEDNIKSWISAGAIAVGIGSQFWNIRALESNGDPELPDQVANVLRWIREARGDDWEY